MRGKGRTATAVPDAPLWTEAPSGTVEAREGTDLLLVARTSANPPVHRYRWWRGAVEIGSSQPSGVEEGKLEMRAIRRDQAGNYSVTAYAPRGNAHSGFLVNVLCMWQLGLLVNGPEAVVAAKRVILDEGATASVLCSAQGNPLPNVTWARKSDKASVLSSGEGEARLGIEEATWSDTGLYLCHASSTVSAAPSVATAVIVTQPPTQTEGKIDRTEDSTGWAAVGGSGRLDCRVTAAPEPAFTWLVEGESQVVSEDVKYVIHKPKVVDEVAEWSSILEVREVTPADFTFYTCVARNALGQHALNLTLGPPVPPEDPYNLTATVVSPSSVVLLWRHDQGYSPARGYTVRYHPAGTRKFFKYRCRDVNSIIVSFYNN
ncbi:neurotrimin-like [Penaeus vannamei]|uniref:neurotrimin-like n=1 Tax=Penaeus vannamei TaxID=6689 RepID=UPI00387F823A